MSAPLIEVLHAFTGLKVNECVYNSLTTLRKRIPIKIITVSFAKLHCNITSHVCLSLTDIFLPCRFSIKSFEVFCVSIYATYNTYFMDLDLNTLIVVVVVVVVVVIIGEDTDYEASNTICPLYDDTEYGSCCGMAWWM